MFLFFLIFVLGFVLFCLVLQFHITFFFNDIISIISRLFFSKEAFAYKTHIHNAISNERKGQILKPNPILGLKEYDLTDQYHFSCLFLRFVCKVMNRCDHVKHLAFEFDCHDWELCNLTTLFCILVQL